MPLSRCSASRLWSSLLLLALVACVGRKEEVRKVPWNEIDVDLRDGSFRADFSVNWMSGMKAEINLESDDASIHLKRDGVPVALDPGGVRDGEARNQGSGARRGHAAGVHGEALDDARRLGGDRQGDPRGDRGDPPRAGGRGGSLEGEATSPVGGPGPFGLPLTEGWILVGAAIALALVLVFWFVRR